MSAFEGNTSSGPGLGESQASVSKHRPEALDLQKSEKETPLLRRGFIIIGFPALVAAYVVDPTHAGLRFSNLIIGLCIAFFISIFTKDIETTFRELCGKARVVIAHMSPTEDEHPKTPLTPARARSTVRSMLDQQKLLDTVRLYILASCMNNIGAAMLLYTVDAGFAGLLPTVFSLSTFTFWLMLVLAPTQLPSAEENGVSVESVGMDKNIEGPDTLNDSVPQREPLDQPAQESDKLTPAVPRGDKLADQANMDAKNEKLVSQPKAEFPAADGAPPGEAHDAANPTSAVAPSLQDKTIGASSTPQSAIFRPTERRSGPQSGAFPMATEPELKTTVVELKKRAASPGATQPISPTLETQKRAAAKLAAAESSKKVKAAQAAQSKPAVTDAKVKKTKAQKKAAKKAEKLEKAQKAQKAQEAAKNADSAKAEKTQNAHEAEKVTDTKAAEEKVPSPPYLRQVFGEDPINTLEFSSRNKGKQRATSPDEHARQRFMYWSSMGEPGHVVPSVLEASGVDTTATDEEDTDTDSDSDTDVTGVSEPRMTRGAFSVNA